MQRLLIALVALLFGAGPALAEVPRVVASIKPIHSLVAAVMGDLGSPALIVKGAASAHTYSLKPSDARAIEAADIVFWTGPDMEVFLADALATLAPRATVVALGQVSGIDLLPKRQGGMFEVHDHGDETQAHHHDEAEPHGHAHGEYDMHMFLDPANARAMVSAIAATLSAADPANAATYAANAAAENAALDQLIADIDAKLAPVRDKPIVVFHDAFQYFERRFGLNVAGSITVSPETMPGADRITRVRDKLGTLQTACVFAEPQFDARIVDVLVEGTPAGRGVLDPEGADLEEGPGLYPALLNAMADSLVACLSR